MEKAPEVEETVSGVVRMESELCTAWIPTALRPKLERTVAPDTELKLALQSKIEIELSSLQPPRSSS